MRKVILIIGTSLLAAVLGIFSASKAGPVLANYVNQRMTTLNNSSISQPGQQYPDQRNPNLRKHFRNGNNPGNQQNFRQGLNKWPNNRNNFGGMMGNGFGPNFGQRRPGTQPTPNSPSGSGSGNP
jgi:hypothetical protein